ncbi:hypothetical protein SCH01S_42_00950 [Sphingomonas changbaiensis NBRC 104936]|uniref:DUF898 domain-containing protein n=1 Tax=Sphingomonas changbaiensis NBRC 104936 TaxID=1219043 RepID=A0A0E9MQK8_9SPHN|nr:YjgN family protein [Sphingomonas changbaiensis]GAO40052.1 hypothetical protein SCH01S_42_00950 [Sphingomonas changbaiensis NBRC 104936]
MNIERQGFDAAAPDSAFRFTGTWREFAPIAFTNLLLTIVTLGIYRFWARARERRYLWSRTEFIDDTLEWTGTGGEMFKGFVVVMALLLPGILFLRFGMQAMILRGQAEMAGLIAAVLYIGFFYLMGVARYRALRYRLSRTYWHGIRGGGDPGGWGYGWSYLWKSVAGWFALALLVPWSMTQLWNERWNRMSFGPHRFESFADTDGLIGRWILILLSPFLVMLAMIPVVVALIFLGALAGFAAGGSAANPGLMTYVAVLAIVVATYGLLAFIGVGYFAAYARKVIDRLELGDLRFAFTAGSKDWLKLFLGHVAVVVGTLGIGFVFLSYRNWSFFIRHLEASGDVELESLTQSPDTSATDAEGLASAFDIGAI